MWQVGRKGDRLADSPADWLRKSMLGNIMIKMTTGRPVIIGVMKEANRFSFI